MQMNKKLKSIFFFSILFFVIDQAIKIFLSTSMMLNQSTVLIRDFFNITYVENTGAAFSIFSDSTLFLIFIGILALVGIIIYILKQDHISDLDVFSYSLLLGGILGNLIDRIFRGYVIDYLSFNIFGYHFPIFNFADICIVGSVILILLDLLKGDLWRS